MTEPRPLPPRRVGTLERQDGCLIYYEVTGSGPAIVFAHGLGGNHMSWFQQVAHFAPRHTCVTFAHRGFAPSTWVVGGPDPNDYADDLTALVAHLNLGDVRVVAQSMGGWSAVEYALRRPSELRAVVLAATTGTIDPMRVREPERSRMAAWLKFSEATSRALFEAGVHPAAGARMASEQPALHLLYRHIDDVNAALDKQALRARLGQGRKRAPEELASAGCPIMFIANDEDAVMPPFAADAIAGVVPGARAVHIPDAGHSAYFERPAVFNRLVEEFFADVAAGAIS
jgi:pimeloyl-ACP methyl ester carboxylesterase